MSQEKPPVKIRYEYKQDDHTRLQYVHGVWGGLTPQGEIELNFYSESDALPSFSERLVASDGSMGHEHTPEDGTKHVVRHIHSKVLFNYHTAKAVLDWLEEKVEALENENESSTQFFDDTDGAGFQQ